MVFCRSRGQSTPQQGCGSGRQRHPREHGRTQPKVTTSWGWFVLASRELKMTPSLPELGPTTKVYVPLPVTSGVTRYSTHVPAEIAPTSSVGVADAGGRSL